MNNSKILGGLIIVLGLATALVHLWLFYNGLMRARGLGFTQYLFLLNGLGYLTLLGALFLTPPSKEQLRDLVHYLFIVFAAVTIIAWAIINRGRFLITLSFFDKAVEVLLIIALWLHLRITQRLTKPVTS